MFSFMATTLILATIFKMVVELGCLWKKRKDLSFASKFYVCKCWGKNIVLCLR
jgi:hypothetical protein